MAEILPLIVTLLLLIVASAFALARLLLKRKKARARHWPQSQDYAVRADWNKSSGELNYSSFVYFDVDRDGIYGIGDRPMGGIVVRLRGRNRYLATVRTNGNGFANFITSTTKRKAAINRPGLYEFAVSVPPGWGATSKNEMQSRSFFELPGSTSGLCTEEMVRPVGIAPERFVRGTLPEGVNAAARVHRGADEVASTELAGSFLLKIPEGADRMSLRLSGCERSVPLGAYPIDLGTCDLSRFVAFGKPRTTISFDDVSSRGLRKIPSGFAGLNWFNLNVIRRDFQRGSQGYVNGNTSGDHMTYTSSGHPAEFWSETPFDFLGALLSAAWLQSEGETGIIECWRGDEPVARDEVRLSALTPVHYQPMLVDITRVRLSTLHYWQMVLDDLTIAR